MNTLLICLIVCTIYSFIIYRALSVIINKKVDNKTFLNSVKEEINSLINQINETSDRNVLLIENRLEKISSALSEADKKLVKFKKESVITRVVPTAPEVVAVDPVVKVENLNSVKEKDITIIENRDIKDDPSLTRRERILLLYKQGISPTVIASQTKATIGEVELIISVNRG